jgi:acyl-CoA thioesterase-1
MMRTVSRLVAAAVLASTLPACGSDRESVTGPPDSDPPVVLALGDSLTAGAGVRAEESYPARLQSRMRTAGFPHRVINAGVSGETSAGALARMDRALDSRTRVLILAAGANDGLRGVPVADLERNLSEMIERAQARDIRVLLCGMETPPVRGWEYTVAFHGVYPSLAARYEVPLMPFLLAGVVGAPDLNLPDRFHPNAAGYERIAANMWPYLEPLLRATS